MQLGMIGLGRMGANMVQRLMKGGHECCCVRFEPTECTQVSQRRCPRAANTATQSLDTAAIAAMTSPMLETGSPVNKPSSGSRTARPSPLSGIET